jgi:hypothetical protein
MSISPTKPHIIAPEEQLNLYIHLNNLNRTNSRIFIIMNTPQTSSFEKGLINSNVVADEPLSHLVQNFPPSKSMTDKIKATK